MEDAELLTAGYGEARITPPLGCRMEGFNRPAGAQAVHDDLHVRCLVLRQGPKMVAVLAFDLLFLERAEAAAWRKRLASRAGISTAQVLLNFTHNHSGPRVSRWHYSGAPDPAYLEAAAAAAETALDSAMASPVPVRIEAALGSASLPVSRRRARPDGGVDFAPDPAAPVCRALPLCLFRAAAGDAVVGYLVSASCHPTINHAPVLSAEYPAVTLRCLNEHFGTTGGVFLQGAGGDAKPVQSVRDGEFDNAASWPEVEAAGRLLAAEARALVDHLEPVAPRLRWVEEEVAFPLETPPARDALEAVANDPAAGVGRQAWAADMLSRLAAEGLPTAVGLIVHGIALGRGLRLLGLECELGSELGEHVLAAAGPGVTFPLGYTNGSRINLPCDRQLPQGGYGVDTSWEYHWPARLAPGIDARLEQAVRHALARLQLD